MGLVTCWNNKSISESKRGPFLLEWKTHGCKPNTTATHRFVVAADSGESVSWLNTATWWLLGEIKEGVYWRSTLEIVITINWRALPPAGSLNNFVHHSDSYLSKSFFFVFFFIACVRASGNVMISVGL